MKKRNSVNMLILFVTLTSQITAIKAQGYNDKLLLASLATTATGLASALFLVYCGGQYRKDKAIQSAFSSMLIAQPFGIPAGIGAYATGTMLLTGISGIVIATSIKLYRGCKKTMTHIATKEKSVHDIRQKEQTAT